MRIFVHRFSRCLLGICAVALFALGCSGSRKNPMLDTERFSLERINTIYAEAEATSLSDLKDDLAQIIEERLTCYSENIMALDRVRECRKKYVREIVALSRSRIKSSPRLGESILCMQFCPIAHAVCAADKVDCTNADCTSEESKCIEYCLDHYWRGGTYAREAEPAD